MRQNTQELRRLSVRPETVALADGPPEAWLWVLSAGLTPERATHDYGFRWIPRYSRVLIPVLERAVDTGGWLSRGFVRGEPKYIASDTAKGKLWSSAPKSDGVVVVVEDVLSAIAVDRAGFMAVAAMGTAFPLPTMALINGMGHTVIPWLDPDKGGRAGLLALRKASSSFPIRLATPVVSSVDPKRYPAADIRRLVEGSLNEH